MKTIFTSALIFSLASFAGTSYQLKCANNDIYTDIGEAKVALNTTITINDQNDYFIDGGNLSFYIEDAWTDQDVQIEKVKNYANYKPRAYKGYAKFPSIGKGFFGQVDFLIPHATLLERKSEFEGIFIMSWIEDHWGGTVSADCSLTAAN